MLRRDPEQLEKLAAIFTFFAADGLDPYQSLVAHFEARRMLGDSEFPFPPRDFDAAPEDVQRAWAEPWQELQQKVAEKAKNFAKEGGAESDVLAAAKELWCSAVEKVRQRFTPCVLPAGKAQLTVIDGGKAPKPPGA